MPSTAALLVKQVRKELATEFPLHLFQVKSNKESLIEVSWEDGPTKAMIWKALDPLINYENLIMERTISLLIQEKYRLECQDDLTAILTIQGTSFYKSEESVEGE